MLGTKVGINQLTNKKSKSLIPNSASLVPTEPIAVESKALSFAQAGPHRNQRFTLKDPVNIQNIRKVISPTPTESLSQPVGDIERRLNYNLRSSIL